MAEREKKPEQQDININVYGDVIGSNLSAGNQNQLNNIANLSASQKSLPIYKNDSNLHPVGDLPLGSYLPLSPNALFTGRENELKNLANNLLDDSKSGTAITQAVTGMGGLGKTQLAVEFGYRYGKYFRGVHWINLADPSQLDSEIANCGRRMFLRDFPEKQSEQVALTLQTWRTDGPNLLILDNFEEPNQANNVFNKLRHSNIRILVTSRRIDWYPTLGLSQLALDVFSPEESISFLQKFFEGSYTNREDSKNDLESLAERLGHLPLSLELASRYLRHKRLKIPKYLEKAENALEHVSMKDWGTDKETATKHDLNLQRTFALSWQEVKKELEQKIFISTGYLAPNAPIPLEVFERTFSISDTKCDESLEKLYDLGLFLQTNIKSLNTESKTSFPIVHPLLCEYARSLAKGNKEILEILSKTLVILSSEALSTGIPANFAPLHPHMPVLATYAKDVRLQGTLWNNLGLHLRDIADYQGSRTMLERALINAEMELIKDNPIVAIRVINLGLVMKALGDLSAAKELFERAWKIFKANRIVEDTASLIEWAFVQDMDNLDDTLDFKIFAPETATLFNAFGSNLQDMGNLNGAKEMYERALKIAEINFGQDHDQVAISLNNLGGALRDLKNFPAAKEKLERAIKIWETNLGTEHPSVASGLNNLAGVLQDMNDLNGAKEMYKRALKIAETHFGENHPDVAKYLNNLGTLMNDTSDVENAYLMYERALKITENILPPNHPSVAIQTHNLAGTMLNLGNIEGARTMFERSLKIHETVFGPNHPKVKELKIILDSISEVPSEFFTNPDPTELEKFASFLINMGELKGAKVILERALSILEKNLVSNDTKIAIVVGQLKNLMRDMGDFNGAKEMFERLLNIYEVNFGINHLKTTNIIHELAEIHYESSDLNSTKEMLERALKIYESNFRKNHPNLSIAFSNLSSLMKELGDMNGAKEMLERALSIDQVNFNRDDVLYVTDIEDIPLISRLQFTGYPADLKIRKTSSAVSELRNRLGDFNDEESFYVKSFYEVALKVFEANLGSNLALGKLYNRLGRLLLTENDLFGAHIIFENARKIFEKNLGSNHPHTQMAISHLSLISMAQKPGCLGRLFHSLLILPRLILLRYKKEK